MNPRMRFDLRPIQRGIKALAPQVKKSRRELAEEAARGFVKEVVAITPPVFSFEEKSPASRVSPWPWNGARLVRAKKLRRFVVEKPIEFRQILLGRPKRLVRWQTISRHAPGNLIEGFNVELRGLRRETNRIRD